MGADGVTNPSVVGATAPSEREPKWCGGKRPGKAWENDGIDKER